MNMQSFKYLLIPGRHQAITTFQENYLNGLLNRDSEKTGFKDAEKIDRAAQVVWAITSANHSGTRRNPLSGARRLGMLEAFAASTGIPSQIYLIPNMSQKPNFAHFLLEDIRLQSRGRLDLRPENCLVVCSTPAVIEQYRQLGFTVATAELDEPTAKFTGTLPWSLVEEVVRSAAQWRSSAVLREELHPACYAHYERYGLGDEIVEIFQDPLIDSDDGDITMTRDYETYRKAFEDNAWRKVADFGSMVEPGRILDVGSATGETLKLLTKQPHLYESDFYGVEAARPLYEIAEQRKAAGDFGDANVFFYQRNIMRSSLFPNNSLNTIITMALTHEIESYLGRAELLAFIKRVYEMIAPGGVYINYDVVAPDNKDQKVHVLFEDADGSNPEDVSSNHERQDAFLKNLSTKARFRRFAQDFRSTEGDGIHVDYENINGKEYAVMRHADLCDFLAKKDYIDSWNSEMHERFCFWEHADWVEALQAVGFILDDTSEAKQNQWLIENRFQPAAKVYCKNKDATLVEMKQPVTNTLLFAHKPL